MMERKLLIALSLSFCLVFYCAKMNSCEIKVNLPEGTTTGTAEEIYKIIDEKQVLEEILKSFSDSHLSYSSINFGYGIKVPPPGEGERKAYIFIRIKFRGDINNAQKIVEQEENIIEKIVNGYFEKKNLAFQSNRSNLNPSTYIIELPCAKRA